MTGRQRNILKAFYLRALAYSLVDDDPHNQKLAELSASFQRVVVPAIKQVDNKVFDTVSEIMQNGWSLERCKALSRAIHDMNEREALAKDKDAPRIGGSPTDENAFVPWYEKEGMA